MANPRTRHVHWRLDPDVVRQLEHLAADNGVSVSYMANYILGARSRTEEMPIEGRDPVERN